MHQNKAEAYNITVQSRYGLRGGVVVSIRTGLKIINLIVLHIRSVLFAFLLIV